MTILDRYILRSLLFNYLIALAVMMSLYTVLDLFFNIDEFAESGKPLPQLITQVLSYYGAHSFLYFSQLSGAITLFACLSTLARMRRANELTAMLASGVSLYRVGAPIVAFGMATSILWYVDTEVFKPRVAHLLARSHDDAAGKTSHGVWLVNDGQTALLSALHFTPADGRLENLLVMVRDGGTVEKVIEAESADWTPVRGHPAGGYWTLTGGIERRRVTTESDFASAHKVEAKPVKVYESYLDPGTLEARQIEPWLEHSSSAQLSELGNREPVLSERIRRTKHGRFAAPLVHVLMLLLGLPFFLSREPANILGDAARCLMVCGGCYMLAYVGENFLRTATLSALPAWLPLIIFAPIAVVLIDRVRT